MSAENGRVTELQNSVYLVSTRVGDVLVNSPPETIKLLLSAGVELPQIVIVPPDILPGVQLGSSGFVRFGFNFASVEFVILGNFFGKGRRTRVIAPTHDQAMRLRVMLEETTTGPTDPNEYREHPYVQTECAAVGNFPPIGHAPGPDDMCDIVSLDRGGHDLGDGVEVHLVDNEQYFVFAENGKEVARVPTAITDAPRPLNLAPPQPLLRNELTLQFIGGSDGFDPSGITTSFLAYIGKGAMRQATLFDTAAYLMMRLGNLGISPHQLSEVVLSHLHEDHLAGLPELLLVGDSRVRLLTSDIIHRSLLRIFSAMFAIPRNEVSKLFDFHPLNPGQPLTLDGRTFEAAYAIHSIPTIAVRVEGLYYSGDMRYDEEYFDELVEQDVLTPERRDELVHFADGAKVLVQDAGGGPIHTTITPALLKALQAKGQRVILAHTSKHELPGADPSMLQHVEFATSGHVSGMGNLRDSKDDDDSLNRIASISASPLFARLSFTDRVNLARDVAVRSYHKGDTIISDGEASDGHVYVVHNGLVEVRNSANELVMLVGRGSIIGERGALADNRERTGYIVARSDSELLAIGPDLFRPYARKLGLREAYSRADWLWSQPVFNKLLWATLLDLALEFRARTIPQGDVLFDYGDPGTESFLLINGSIAIYSKNGELLEVIEKPGEYFGGRAALNNILRNASAKALRDSIVWAMPASALQRLDMVYPKIMLHLRAIEANRRGTKMEGTGPLRAEPGFETPPPGKPGGE